MQKALFIFFSAFLIALTQLSFADVYPDTIQQRRDLTTEEKQHLLHIGEVGKGNCSASALTPEIMITAEHCSDLRHGYFEYDPTQTFDVVSKNNQIIPLEVSSHYANDVILLKIKWKAGKAPSLLRYPRELAHTEDQLKFGSDADATKLFTLGYPADLGKFATYSWGYLKDQFLLKRSTGKIDPYTHDRTEEAIYLRVNVPLINGNSGGPIYTENYKLVGIVQGGSGILKQDQSGPDFHSQNPKYWNFVGALFHLYPRMKTLQAIFPNGINPRVNENGEWIKN